jgi:hypothetical protein
MSSLVYFSSVYRLRWVAILTYILWNERGGGEGEVEEIREL